MDSLFDKEVYGKVVERIGLLNHDSEALWGTMNVAQMMDHCILPLQQSLGNIELKQRSTFLWRFFKKSLYNDKLWKTNLPTAPEFKITDAKSIEESKTKLLAVLKEYHLSGETFNWRPHIRFGHFTGEQMGKMGFKHLDHHLRQFNV